METKTGTYAELELNILLQTVKDPIIKDFIPEILAICDKFGKSGQSGGSAPFTAAALSQAIKKLCLQEPICDITGVDSEWVDCSEYSAPKSETQYQNKRCYGLFKKKNGDVNYVDAIIFKLPSGTCFSGSAKLPDGSKIRSSQKIKGFPFKPKTFYLDITEEEISKDNWEFTLADAGQLKAVYKYYKK